MKQHTLDEIRDETLVASQHNKDFSTDLPGLVAAMQDPRTVISPEGEEIALTKKAFLQLTRDRMGLPPAIFESKAISKKTKLAILGEVAEGRHDQIVQVRMAGQQIDAFLSQQYGFFDNTGLVMTLCQMRDEGLLPEDLQAQTFHVSPGGRSLNVRFRSEEWAYMLGRNGGSRRFFGNWIIGNNELASGSLRANVALTRNDCLNSVIGRETWAVEHRTVNEHKDFVGALLDSATHVRRFSQEMFEQMRAMRDVSIEAPLLIFAKIAEDLKIPKYAIGGIHSYWEEHGSKETLYDVVQAVTAGTKALTEVSGRKQPLWERRTALEHSMWDVASSLQAMHAGGESLDDYYMHGDMVAQELCARYVEGFSTSVPDAPMLAAGIRELEMDLN